MNQCKKWLAIGLTGMMIFSAAGCSSTGKEAENNKPSETRSDLDGTLGTKDALYAGDEKLSASENYTGSLKIDFALQDDTGQSSSMVTTTELNLVQSPLLAMMKTTSIGGQSGDASANQEMTSTVYIEEKDGVFTSYMENNSLWQKIEAEEKFIDYVLNQYDPKASFHTYIQSVYEVRVAGTEEIDGIKATKYEGIIPGASLQTIAYERGLFTYVGAANLPGDYYITMPDVKMVFYISPEGYPIKYSIDLTEALQGFFDQAREELLQAGNDVESVPAKTTVERYIIEGMAGNFGKASAIEIPEEARNATSIETDTPELTVPPTELPAEELTEGLPQE